MILNKVDYRKLLSGYNGKLFTVYSNWHRVIGFIKMFIKRYRIHRNYISGNRTWLTADKQIFFWPNLRRETCGYLQRTVCYWLASLYKECAHKLKHMDSCSGSICSSSMPTTGQNQIGVCLFCCCDWWCRSWCQSSQRIISRFLGYFTGDNSRN